jgi:hypothetical protein
MVARLTLLAVLAGTAACGGPRNEKDAGAGDATPSDACATPFACVDAGTVLDAAPPKVCPEAAPDAGAPCDYPLEDCEYGDTTSFDCSLHLSCSGSWTVSSYGPCVTPEPCPASVPDGGCSSWGEACAYPDAGVTCVCTACGAGPPPPGGIHGAWTCASPGPGCALVRPDDGTACDLPDGSVCAYTAGGCCTGAYSGCEHGVWMGEPKYVCP